MSTNSPFRALTELITSLNSSIANLENGNLSVEELAPLLDDARELHERLAILQYLIHTKKEVSAAVSEVEEVLSEKNTEESVIESKISEAMDSGVIEKPNEKKGVKINFNLFNAPEQESVNQINLLDVIAAEVKEESILEDAVEVQVDIEKKTIVEERHSINQVIAKVSEKLSLNEKLADGNEKTNLATKLSRKPIKDLNEEIGLNQKFLFMNDLFGGENGLYKEAITAFNNFTALEQATELINQLKTRHNWDMESISVTKFIDLVERRFLV
jgi:hypothetical protein